MKMKIQPTRICGTQQSPAKGKVWSCKCLHQKTETSQINNLMMHLKKRKKQTKPKTSRQREILKSRQGLMRLKPKKLYKESMKQKVGSLKRLTRLTNS
jgi:Zn-finger protein